MLKPMNKPSSQLCPKCNRPFIRKVNYNFNYDIYIHKQKESSKWLYGLIDYCIVTKDYVYDHPKPDVTSQPLNPGYRTLKP